ncbi:hypothetical protein KSC_069030 [Ktedonobacter sp. SOSP1-52]|uniref:ATP-binding cassette domain-containing protein n=1 Tax=Ktedonobacter sp. SOSP1-52 TaxID=2778366 RepID=UPI00191523D1|nr:ATP-binding cassette domain-containing protein [Ktedonobacter sp. SOSP1-52]GHO68011.1 hypothetical protein KSC_069030 [Ktedonobacter sp. SOSP1-52]
MQRLSKRFGNRTAVDGLTIGIPAGTIAGFVGPNGAGKTTTIRLLLGLVRPNAGSATILGHPLTASPNYLPRVEALIEAPAFYPSLSGRTNMISVIRAFRSEVLKFRRWSVLAGAGMMLVVSTFIAYLTFHQIASGTTGLEMTGLIASFHTPQGLVSVIGQARSLIIAIALILVSANLAAEWTQGTLRNLLVREPHRLRWLAGKMLAVVLFVLLSMLLTFVISSTFILILAQGQGIQTTAWTSAEGLRIFLESSATRGSVSSASALWACSLQC